MLIQNVHRLLLVWVHVPISEKAVHVAPNVQAAASNAAWALFSTWAHMLMIEGYTWLAQSVQLARQTHILCRAMHDDG